MRTKIYKSFLALFIITISLFFLECTNYSTKGIDDGYMAYNTDKKEPVKSGGNIDEPIKSDDPSGANKPKAILSNCEVINKATNVKEEVKSEGASNNENNKNTITIIDDDKKGNINEDNNLDNDNKNITNNLPKISVNILSDGISVIPDNLNQSLNVPVMEKTEQQKLDEELNEKINHIKNKVRLISKFRREYNDILKLSLRKNDYISLKSGPLNQQIDYNAYAYFDHGKSHESYRESEEYDLEKTVDIKRLINKYSFRTGFNFVFAQADGTVGFPKTDAPFTVFPTNVLFREILDDREVFDNVELSKKGRKDLFNKKQECSKTVEKFDSTITKIKEWISLFDSNNKFAKSNSIISFITDFSRKKEFNNVKDKITDMLELCDDCEKVMKSVQSWLMVYMSAYLKKCRAIYELLPAKREDINKVCYLVDLLMKKDPKISEEDAHHYSILKELDIEGGSNIETDYAELRNSIEKITKQLENLQQSVAIVE